MDCEPEERLDRIYLTIDDFLNSRHCSPEATDQTRSPENCIFHFNKPGFDMAVIITDKSLISTIDEFHIPFQRDLGLITHTIYLPDVSRLKFCIRDLKLQEILYAIIVSEKNKAVDKYDLFILNNVIELQKELPYEDAIDLVKSDFVNYMEVLKISQKDHSKYPHARSGHIEGFIEPTSHIRYLLCLLFDNRMLSFGELQELKGFVHARKSAIEALGTSTVNYAMNDRPIPAYRQEKLKYYTYSLNEDGRQPRAHQAKMPTKTVPHITKKIETRVIKPNSEKPYAPPAVGKPIVPAIARKPDAVLGKDAPKSAIITAPPVLYTKPTGSLASPTPAQTQQPPSTNTVSPPDKNLFAKPQNVVPQQIINKVVAMPQASNMTSPPPRPITIASSQTTSKESANVRASSTSQLAASKSSSFSTQMAASNIEIDLTDEFTAPSAKKSKPNYPIRTPAVAAHSTGISQERQVPASSQSKLISSNALMYLMKFFINLSPLSLLPTNVAISMLKKCVQDMENYLSSKGMKCSPVDVRQCRIGGCLDIIRIIEALCNETIAAKHNVSDIQFMWQHFPKSISEDSVTITFYKLMKMFEVAKLVYTSNDILMKMVQGLQQVANYNFQIKDPNTFPTTSLDYFPTMFPEFFKQRAQLYHLNMNLPPPEPLPSAFIDHLDVDKSIVENKIKFVVGPLLEFFISIINSVHHKLDLKTVEEIYGALRTFRFCLRKICVRVLPERLQKQPPRSASVNIIDRTNELLEEINVAVKEVRAVNCVLFTKKHYELISVLLDVSIKVEQAVSSDLEADFFDKEFLVHLNPVQFVHEFSCTVKTAVMSYHPDTEVDVLKTALKNRWIDMLHDAFKGVPPEPDGSRLSKEVTYLLPKGWGKHAFDEAVIEAAMLSYSHWEKMLSKDFVKTRLLYSNVRNNYLMWLAKYQLDHRKAMELMTANQRMLDAKILQMSS